jgi:D-3-phosphoglycerate dehydrogenase
MEKTYSAMKVLNVEPYGYSDIAKQKWVEENWFYSEADWNQVLKQEYNDVDALIIRLSRKIGHQELSHFPNLKYLITATTGLDHVDISVVENRGIKLISLRGETDFLKTIPSTAEHTWALCLALIRNIPSAVSNVMSGQWNRDAYRGYQMKAKKIGVIGLGRTGNKVAGYANAFDMIVSYYDPYVIDERYKKYDSLPDLLRDSDIITIHVHLTPETESMLNASNIPYIKKGAILINTSRGKLWDEYCLVSALVTEQIHGIATDVLSSELDNCKESPLWEAMADGKNVIITPHIGGATWDAMWSCEEYLVNKILSNAY